MALQVQDAVDRHRDRLNLSFFWVCRIGSQLKIVVPCQKCAGKRQVWRLDWNEAIGGMESSLFPAFECLDAGLERPEQAKWN